MQDVLADEGLLFLGSRLKRLGERMQADVARLVEAAGLPVQPAHYPLLFALDRHGAMPVGDLATAVGASQPLVTRGLARLSALGLIESTRGQDQRRRLIALTAAGAALMVQSKTLVWPQVEAAAADLCGPDTRAILTQLRALEVGLTAAPLDQRARSGPSADLRIRPWTPDLAQIFHDINAEWIGAMFRLEPTDIDVLTHPAERIVAPGGDILFVESDALGVIGTCALQKTSEGRFELTKMGVREAARGRKAGEFLLRATLRRARELRADTLYLLTSSRCAPAIHLYEKLGFAHDPAIMAEYGSRYARGDVAMRYMGEG